VDPEGGRKPKISFLVTAHNSQGTIEETLSSIAHQTIEDWELVVVLDGCTDATPEIVEKWARRDDRIVVRSLPRVGRGAALNIAALEMARAEILAIQDADDVSFPWRASLSINALESYGSEFPIIGAKSTSFVTTPSVPDPPTEDVMTAQVTSATARLRSKGVFAHSTVALLVSHLRDLGGYDVRRRGQFDADLYARTLEHKQGVGFLDVPLSGVRLHEFSSFVGSGNLGYRWNGSKVRGRILAASEGPRSDYLVHYAKSGLLLVPGGALTRLQRRRASRTES
jgi:glycosyltransferase EpsE